MSDAPEEFAREVAANVHGLRRDDELRALTLEWIARANRHRYTYNFHAFGRPLIQLPQDVVAVQELIWSVQPDLVVETGIAHGGSLLLSAGALAMLDYRDAVVGGTILDPRASRRRVVGIDIDLRPHNRAALEAHPLAHLMTTVDGSSVDPGVVEEVHDLASSFERILVLLDSNHTHDHVLAELESYAPLASRGSYCVVFDTLIEDLPADQFTDRPWCVGNSPKTAVHAYLELLSSEGRTGSDGEPLLLEIDSDLDARLMLTVAPDGYLRRS